MADAGKGRVGVWAKRIGYGIAGLVLILILSAVLVPLLVDIDKYRPQIVKIANEHINGELEIGELSLSLWGQVEIDIDGLVLKGTEGATVVAVDETYAQISFLSILSGTPELLFKMERPNVNVLRDAQGNLNVLGLIKEKPAQEPPAQQTSEPTGPPSAPVIDMVSSAGLDVEMIDAHIVFKDLASDFTQEFEALNLRLNDLSLSRDTTLRIWGDLNTKLADVISLSGPFEITGTITPEFEDLAFQKAGVVMAFDFDKILIDMGETFQKPKGVPANIQLAMSATPEVVDVSELLIRFHNAELKAKAKLSGLQSPDPLVEFNLLSQPIDLSEWARLVVALKQLELEGRMDLAASASGPLSKLDYQAKVDIQDLVANAPGLQARPKMQFGLEVVTNAVKALRFDFEAPGTDLAVRGSLQDFSSPVIAVNVTSRAIDLDQLLPPPPEQGKTKDTEPAEPKDKEQTASTEPDPAKSEPATDVDKQLDSLRNNEYLKSIVAKLTVDIGKFKGRGIEASNIMLVAGLDDLVGAIEKLNLNIFKGLVKANAQVDLKPAQPSYRMNLNVNHVDMQTAVETQFESLANTLLGNLSVKASGSGKSLNADQILPNLDMAGSFKITEATFATVDVGKMVVSAINESIEDIKKKIPPLADREIKTPENFRSRYEEISSGFVLKGGVFSAPNFKTVAVENEGIDIEGKTTADLVNDKLNADWFVIDTYNITKAHDVEVNMNGVEVDHILAKDGEPVKFPVKVGCKLSEPCYQYGQVAKYLANVALDNVRQAAGQRINKEVDKAKARAKAELEKRKKAAKEKLDKKRKEAEDKAKKKVQDKAKDAADKLKDRFGF